MLDCLTHSPDLLAVCPCDGQIILVMPWPDGTLRRMDPGFTARRFARSWYGPEYCDRHGFARDAPLLERPHVCPPPGKRPMTLREHLRRLKNHLSRPAGEGRG